MADSVEKSLFDDLKRIGIDEALAYRVSISLDPDYNASKKDVLTMQEAILQVQLKTDVRYHDLNNKIDKVHYELSNKIDKVDNKVEKVNSELNSKIDRVYSDLRVEIAATSRQFWITFGGLICTILSVFLVNWYYHL